MIEIDTSGWDLVGESSNSRYFVVEKNVLAAVPRPGSIDDEKSAKDNLAFQHDHWRERGPGVIVIFFDNMVSQDKGARRVYQQEADPALMLGTALVGGSLLSRAMGSFFLGLTKPRIPLKMFGSLDEALVWARQINSAKQEG